MKVRGSQTITKNLTLPNPGGSTPILGRVAYTDAEGSISWQDVHILEAEARTYPNKMSLVYSGTSV